MATLIPYSNYDRTLRRFPFDMFDEVLSSPLVSVATDGSFTMDVEDTGDTYVVTAELAGVNKDDIDVELNEGRLSISVEKHETEEHKSKNFIHKESHEWSATRGVYLKDAATAGLTAKLDNGVLTVNIPKKEAQANVTKVSID